MSDTGALSLVRTIDTQGQPNSVDVHDGIVAVAVENDVKTSPGWVKFYRADGTPLGQAVVGALPDMLTFTKHGRRVLVANEGEPNSYGQPNSIDPEGSVSIINLDLTGRPDKDEDGDSKSSHIAILRVRTARFRNGIPIFGSVANAMDLIW